MDDNLNDSVDFCLLSLLTALALAFRSSNDCVRSANPQSNHPDFPLTRLAFILGNLSRMPGPAATQATDSYKYQKKKRYRKTNRSPTGYTIT